MTDDQFNRRFAKVHQKLDRIEDRGRKTFTSSELLLVCIVSLITSFVLTKCS